MVSMQHSKWLWASVLWNASVLLHSTHLSTECYLKGSINHESHSSNLPCLTSIHAPSQQRLSVEQSILRAAMTTVDRFYHIQTKYYHWRQHQFWCIHISKIMSVLTILCSRKKKACRQSCTSIATGLEEYQSSQKDDVQNVHRNEH